MSYSGDAASLVDQHFSRALNQTPAYSSDTKGVITKSKFHLFISSSRSIFSLSISLSLFVHLIFKACNTTIRFISVN